MYAINDFADDLDAFFLAVKEHRAYLPLYVKIKLFFGCNLKCEMCNHWRTARELPLSFERLKEILSELSASGCRKVHFSGGEPLLRPQVSELVEYASILGMRATLTTNGTLVDKYLARQLVESGLRGVNVSIDSPQRKVHDRLRGIEGAWKKACRAVQFFHRYSYKGKITLRINTVVSRLNYNSLASLPDFAQALGANAINLIALDDHCGEHLALRRRHIEDFNANIAPRIAERGLELGLISQESQAYPYGQTIDQIRYTRRGQYALGWYDQHPCFAPWLHSLIDFNGLVYICCMTREQTHPIGDLKKCSFDDIWNGEGYRSIRECMWPPKLSPCKRCDDFVEQNRYIYEMVSGGESIAQENL